LQELKQTVPEPADGTGFQCVCAPDDHPISAADLAAMEQAGYPPPAEADDEAGELTMDGVIAYINNICGRHLGNLALRAFRNEWQLDQIQEDVRQLQSAPRYGGHLSRPSSTKNPSFLRLLPKNQRIINPNQDKPVVMATHPKDESREQTNCRQQRDTMIAENQHVWLDDNQTWAKITDEVKARMCISMAMAPAHWNWEYTMLRVIERIAYDRGKAKKIKKKTPTKNLDALSAAADFDLTDDNDTVSDFIDFTLSRFLAFSLTQTHIHTLSLSPFP
jgi:hypothetical protein